MEFSLEKKSEQSSANVLLPSIDHILGDIAAYRQMKASPVSEKQLPVLSLDGAPVKAARKGDS